MNQKSQEMYPEKGKERQILIFSLSNQEFGLDLSHVREVLRLGEIHTLPKVPDFIEGVTHLRGHIIALINLRKRLQLTPKVDGPEQKVIICQIDRMTFGILVEGFKEIISMTPESIKPLPSLILGEFDTELISEMAKIGERIIPLLNLSPLIYKKDSHRPRTGR